MCRNEWEPTTSEVIPVDRKLDSRSVQIYVDWLYSDNLNILDEDKSFYPNFISTWHVSSVFNDLSFRYAIIAKYINHMRHKDYPGFSQQCLEYTFVDYNIGAMRSFIVQAFLMTNEAIALRKNGMIYTFDFMRAIAFHLMRTGKPKKDLGALLFRYTDGHYALTEKDDGKHAAYDNERSDADDTSDTRMSLSG